MWEIFQTAVENMPRLQRELVLVALAYAFGGFSLMWWQVLSIAWKQR